MSSGRRIAVESVGAGALLAVAGALAWVTGRPLVFPSLGPSAYVLATDAESTTASRVLGGHAVGVVAGLVSYHALAGGAFALAAHPPADPAAARLAVSAVCAVGLTTAGTAAARVRHTPACATTLIVALGLLSTPADALVVGVGVTALYLSAVAGRRALGVARARGRSGTAKPPADEGRT
ncbi:HPP family protein [Candidatus Halobonum tyrrellensis]|uniref:HPP transmembrane region domain-containing protein n=1 Tax=Candidatus Halobonum tyrrellensis G22 TaxID=1324957 RepID=V4J1Q6_9EURY|nr:HPP family protein [Candidatus Halobonum tyrrellensis]ESP89342.1 hypothetical protein K933_04971 [Candidatus Halobonum tyrrellensis G22]